MKGKVAVLTGPAFGHPYSSAEGAGLPVAVSASSVSEPGAVPPTLIAAVPTSGAWVDGPGRGGGGGAFPPDDAPALARHAAAGEGNRGRACDRREGGRSAAGGAGAGRAGDDHRSGGGRECVAEVQTANGHRVGVADREGERRGPTDRGRIRRKRPGERDPGGGE